MLGIKVQVTRWISTILIGVLAAFFLTACQSAPAEVGPAHPAWMSWLAPQEPPATATPTPLATQAPGKTIIPPTSVSQPPLKPSQTPSPQPLPAVHESDLSGLAIQVLHPWTGSAGSGFQSLVDEFNRGNTWGIRVDVVMAGSQSAVSAWMDGALSTPQPTSTTPGLDNPRPVLPDVLVTDGMGARSWQAEGPVIVGMGQFASDATWGLKAKEAVDLQVDQWPGMSAPVAGAPVSDPPVSGAPAQRELVFLIYNQTWARALGFDQPPATPDEFRIQACKAAKANQYDPDLQRRGTGGWLVSADPLSLQGWIEAFGGQVGPNAGGQYSFSTPPVTQAFSFLKGLEDKNCAWQARDPLPYTYFASREALFYLGNLDDLATQRLAMQKDGRGDQWTAIPFPAINGKALVIADDLNYYLLKSTPARQLAAWLFVRWMESPEQQVRWMMMVSTVPVGQSVQAILGGFRAGNPQWAAAFDLVPLARPQPDQVSWGMVKPALNDGGQQILQSGATADAIPAILAQLDRTCQELLKKAP